jgi:hypothetical protein
LSANVYCHIYFIIVYRQNGI